MEVFTSKMLTEKQKSLLAHIKNVPEWQSALIYEQLASLNKAASALADASSYLEHGFANSKLRPDQYYRWDAATRRDWRTGPISNAASAMGDALAALELLAALADAYQQDFQHAVEYTHDMHYNELEKLCIKHGYQEDNT